MWYLIMSVWFVYGYNKYNYDIAFTNGQNSIDKLMNQIRIPRMHALVP